jgi:Virulence activator alpha C-term
MHAEQLARYEAQRATIGPGLETVDPFAAATLDFGITYERAVMDWFERLPASISGTLPHRPEDPSATG